MGAAKYCACKNTYSIECGNKPCKKENPYLDDTFIGSLVGQGESIGIDSQRHEVHTSSADQRETYKKIKQISLLPGSGEYLYSTEVVTKEFSGDLFQSINNNSNTNKADAVVALDDLIETYPNLEGLSLIVSWYGDADDDSMTIKPRQDRHENVLAFSQDWNVGNYTRTTAPSASLVNGVSNVGGTPGDESLIQFVDLCNEKGIKVMLYPFLMSDTVSKGWRGSMSFDGTQSSLDSFMVEYKAFVRHYSQLFGGTNKLDKFAIGSELESLTRLTINGEYEGVNALIQLAQEVKSDFGTDSTSISYAANWSEYHSHNGNYNLDALWSNSNIDEIGVDYYMPLTDFQLPRTVTYEDIIEGFESGEGWDHYYNTYNDQSSKVDFNPKGGASAWKNIFGWWNEDRPSSGWTSRMKPLYFSEYGFASVDGTTNQPNVFAPQLPRLSSNTVDFEIQRDAIAAFNDYWDNKTEGVSGFAEQRFAWAADLRPYPQFPQSNIWGDSGDWEKGHWFHGKV